GVGRRGGDDERRAALPAGVGDRRGHQRPSDPAPLMARIDGHVLDLGLGGPLRRGELEVADGAVAIERDEDMAGADVGVELGRRVLGELEQAPQAVPWAGVQLDADRVVASGHEAPSARPTLRYPAVSRSDATRSPSNSTSMAPRTGASAPSGCQRADQVTRSPATCLRVTSIAVAPTRWSRRKRSTASRPRTEPCSGNGARDSRRASSERKPTVASTSPAAHADSNASAVRNSPARARPWAISPAMKAGSRLSFEVGPSPPGSADRDSSMIRTTMVR